jgi:hypothetical protein
MTAAILTMQQKLKKDTVDGGWGVVNRGVGGGWQWATADADKALALKEKLNKMK